MKDLCFTTSLRLVFWMLASVGFLVLSRDGWAADSPLAMIRSTVEQAMAVIEDPSYQGKDRSQERMKKVEEIVLPQIDSWELARRSLGTHWSKINDEQRQQFVQLFTALIEKSYGNMLERYPQGVRFSFDQERIDGDFAEVDTQVFSPARDTPFSVTYRLHLVDGKWRMYDVVVDNVSMVSNYRNQFNRVIASSSYEGLVQAIQQKLEQLQNAPESVTGS
jgi:phospholipid transport system substrate-binding protein